MELQLQGTDMESMYELYEELAQAIGEANIASELEVSEPAESYEEVSYRGDAGTLITVAVAAVSAGGALSVLLGKEGVIAKWIESKQVELVIEENGKKTHYKGPVANLSEVLENHNV
ncbi:hypothetical protein EOL70_11080 [Leucothrix sargassi]|nr:hypothetical protein EOL70_11080 [Leucothrix sargassi]